MGLLHSNNKKPCFKLSKENNKKLNKPSMKTKTLSLTIFFIGNKPTITKVFRMLIRQPILGLNMKIALFPKSKFRLGSVVRKQAIKR